MEKKRVKITKDQRNLLITILGGVLSTITLAQGVTSIGFIVSENLDSLPFSLMGMFFLLCVCRSALIFKFNNKLNSIKNAVYGLVFLVLGILSIFANSAKVIYSIVAVAYIGTIIANRITVIIEKKKKRTTVFNILLILICVLLLVVLIGDYENIESLKAIMLILCVMIVVKAFVEIMLFSFSRIEGKLLFKIIRKTYAAEVLVGLLALMVSSSIVFMHLEQGFNSFGDGMWYCFSIVTTIGFGDIIATTIFGRVLSALLGVYGIIVVALLTSIIVNFYNETVQKEREKQEKIEKAKEIKENQPEEDPNNINK